MTSTKVRKQKVELDVPEIPFFDVEARLAAIDELFSTRFRIQGVEFKIGEEVKVSWDMLSTALNKLFVLGYAQQYHLLPPNIPCEVLTGMSKDIALQYVPLLVANIMRRVDSNTIDISAPNNRALVAIVDIMSWYWYQHGGPRPETTQMIREVKLYSRHQKYFQNEVLSCPLCNKQYVPPTSYKTQQSKFWAWVRWLPQHAIEYHRYVKPGSKSTKKDEVQK